MEYAREVHQSARLAANRRGGDLPADITLPNRSEVHNTEQLHVVVYTGAARVQAHPVAHNAPNALEWYQLVAVLTLCFAPRPHSSITLFLLAQLVRAAEHGCLQIHS